MSTNLRQVVGVLFSDVKGFSKLADDRLSLIVKQHVEDFVRKSLTSENHFYHNTWGDGLIVCAYDPHDLLETALKLNDWFSNKNWGRDAFAQPQLVRIGLHVDKVTVIIEGGQVVDVDGKNVNKTARIEPIVEAGHIYCSKQFRDLTEDEGKGFVQFVDLGLRDLAKEFGTLHLFEVTKTGTPPLSRPAQQTTPSMAMPALEALRIRREFTDLDKENYLQDCYAQVRDYFQAAIPELRRKLPDLDARIENVRSNKFTYHVFIKGAKKAECQVWIGNAFMKGICYADAVNDHDNSLNESFSVQSDGYELSISSMGFSFSGGAPSRVTKENIGEVVWKRFQRNLER